MSTMISTTTYAGYQMSILKNYKQEYLIQVFLWGVDRKTIPGVFLVAAAKILISCV